MHRQIILSYLPRFINLLVVPVQMALLTKNLSVESYGIWNMLLSSGFAASMIFSLGLQKVLSIKVPGRSLYIQLSFFKAVLVAESLAYIALSILFLALCLPWVVPALNIEGYDGAVVAILLAFLVNLIYNEFGRLFNYQKRIEIRLLIGCFEKILELGLIYAAISWIGKADLNQLSLVYIVLYLILLLANIFFFRGFKVFFKVRLRFPVIKSALMFGAPLILSDVAWKLIQNFDFYMLSAFDRQTELGLYAFMSRLINYIYLAAAPIIWVVYPYLVESFHKEGNQIGGQARYLLSAQLKYSTLFLLAAMGGVLINLEWLVDLLANEAYSQNVTAYLMFAPYPVLVTLIFLGQQVLLLDKKNRYVFISYAVGLLVNIGGNLVLIPALGIIGAIITTLVSLVIILSIQARHFSPLRYLSGALAAMMIIQVVVIGTLVHASLSWPVENLLFATELAVTAFLFRLVDFRAISLLLIRT
ncbi:oligosaccharide flippase family protein [Alphaproteobacteria bacterium LSUCC0396]